MMFLLVITFYHWSLYSNKNEIEFMYSDNASEIYKIIALQDIHCEKVSYTEPDKMQLKWFWELVNDYKVFHKDNMKKLYNGKSTDVRTLTWHCGSTYPCGGLGYRVMGITVSLLFAMLTNRVMLLKWDRTSAEDTYLLPNMIDWRYPNFSLNGSFKDLGCWTVHTKGITNSKYREQMIQSLTGNTMHIQMLYNSVRYLDEFIPMLSSAPIRSLNLSWPSNLLLFHTVSFMHLFKISKKVQPLTDKVHKKLNIHGKRYVALHIRTGDVEGVIKSRFIHSFKNALQAVQCAIRQADEKIGSDSPIVLVSDSVSLKKRLAKINSRIKILNNSIVHVDKAKELDNSGILGVWQDIIIMAEAHIMMYYRSTFAQLSVAICGLPKERIVSLDNCNT